MSIGKDGSMYALKAYLKKVPKERRDPISSTIRLTKNIKSLEQITKESIVAILL